MVHWEELPQEILELIVGRLAMEDLLAVRRVCTAWQSAAARERYNAKSKPPWLMTHNYSRTVEFSTGRIHAVQLPGCYEYEKTLSKSGWILVLEGYRKYQGYRKYRIFNPFSYVSIELPALPVKLHRKLSLIDTIALSSSPSLSKNYTVMFSYSTSPKFAFLRSGEDAWTVVSPVTASNRCTALELIYYNGLFVALDVQSQISTLNERESRMESRLFLGLNRYVDGLPYLVECSGSLLAAWMIWGQKCGRPVIEIRVFRGTEEEVKSLENASLFLYRNSSFSVEFNADSCLPGITPNHVYFREYEVGKMVSYSMKDGNLDLTSSHIQEARWFQPDF